MSGANIQACEDVAFLQFIIITIFFYRKCQKVSKSVLDF